MTISSCREMVTRLKSIYRHISEIMSEIWKQACVKFYEQELRLYLDLNIKKGHRPAIGGRPGVINCNTVIIKVGSN